MRHPSYLLMYLRMFYCSSLFAVGFDGCLCLPCNHYNNMRYLDNFSLHHKILLLPTASLLHFVTDSLSSLRSQDLLQGSLSNHLIRRRFLPVILYRSTMFISLTTFSASKHAFQFLLIYPLSITLTRMQAS